MVLLEKKKVGSLILIIQFFPSICLIINVTFFEFIFHFNFYTCYDKIIWRNWSWIDLVQFEADILLNY